MAERESLTREAVVNTLVEGVQPLEFVHAFWEGGAVAFGRLDEWSDIDAYIVVDDGRAEETFAAVEKALESLSGIKQKYDIGKTPWPGVYQAFYKLRDAGDYLVIDLAVLEMSSPDKFLESEIHGDVRFYFNKSDEIKVTKLNRNGLGDRIRKRLLRLRDRLDMFGQFVQKEINRGNEIEAVDAYKVIVLDTLIEVLRMKYHPSHFDFKTRYVQHELPSEVLDQLTGLCFVKDMEDLEEKYDRAMQWTRRTIAELNIALDEQ